MIANFKNGAMFFEFSEIWLRRKISQKFFSTLKLNLNYIGKSLHTFYFIDMFSTVQRRPTLPCIAEEDLVVEDLEKIDEDEGIIFTFFALN